MNLQLDHTPEAHFRSRGECFSLSKERLKPARSGLNLQSTKSLTSPDWQPEFGTPIPAEGRFWVTNTISASTRFFRLTN